MSRARITRTAAGAALAASLSLLVCAQAHAGHYRVQTCTTADWRSLGPTIGSPSFVSGWDYGFTSLTPTSLRDGCPTGGMFFLEVPGNGFVMPTGQSVWVRWTAAPGTQLTAVSTRWGAIAELNPARSQGVAQLTVATDQEQLLARNTPLTVSYGLGGAPALAAQLRPAHWFEIRLSCMQDCLGSAFPISMNVRVAGTAFDVADPFPPVGGLAGSAVDAQTWSGVVLFTLNAADAGGGVARAVLELDGTDARSIPLGDPRICQDLREDPTIPEYPAAQPCPVRIDSRTLAIDTNGLPQGPHVVRVLLEDAAGNRTAVFGPVTRTIATNRGIGPGSDPTARGEANGVGASDQARLTAHWGRRSQRTSLVSAFGHAHVVRGRLTTQEGAPISGATIDLVSKTTAVNARPLAKRVGARTGSDGSWFVVLPRTVSSRDLSFGYRSHVNDTIATATAALRLRVRAGVRLKIRPRHARRGQAIRFSGRLLGGPMPRGGKQIVLMARTSRGAWVRFNVVRADARGRFAARYRFQQPGTARYRFRALSLAEAAYPYLAGGSNVVTVLKR